MRNAVPSAPSPQCDDPRPPVVLGNHAALTARARLIFLKLVDEPRLKYSGVFGHVRWCNWHSCADIHEALEFLSSGRGVFDRVSELV